MTKKKMTTKTDINCLEKTMIPVAPDLLAGIRDRLRNPLLYDWTAHGTGSIRTMIGKHRLEVWSSEVVTPNASAIHTTPCDVLTEVVVGGIQLYRWIRHGRVSDEEQPFTEWLLTCGVPPADLDLQRIGEVFLLPRAPETYLSDMIFQHTRDEIKQINFIDGTVTLTQRSDNTLGDRASVFSYMDLGFVDATRQTSPDQIKRVTKVALEIFNTLHPTKDQ